jgi:hypothetical protein
MTALLRRSSSRAPRARVRGRGAGDPLVAVGDVERRADLAGVPALDVAQHEDVRLARGQLGDRVADAVERLTAEHALLGQRAPVRRSGRPVPGPAVAFRPEALGVDDVAAVVVLAEQRRERRAATLAHRPCAGAVGQDLKHPGLQRRAPFEAIDPVQDGKPRLLDDLLGHGAVADERAREAQHRGLVAPDERDERRFVARSQRGDDVRVAVHARWPAGLGGGMLHEA